MYGKQTRESFLLIKLHLYFLYNFISFIFFKFNFHSSKFSDIDKYILSKIIWHAGGLGHWFYFALKLVLCFQCEQLLYFSWNLRYVVKSIFNINKLWIFNLNYNLSICRAAKQIYCFEAKGIFFILFPHKRFNLLIPAMVLQLSLYQRLE